jgi:hypothetical protein
VADLNLQQIGKELLRLTGNGNCVAWVGSGLSRAADYPGWRQTVRALCTSCGEEPLSSSEERDADKLIDKAEDCKRSNLTAYEDTLARLFGREVVETRHLFYVLMGCPFKGYVTTNFDPLLAYAACAYGYDTVCTYPALRVPIMEKAERPIFHVHGLARRNNAAVGTNLVLARSDFDRAYRGGGVVSHFLSQVLTSYDVLFIGASLAEPDAREVLRRVRDIHLQIAGAFTNSPRTRRVALLPTRKTKKETDGERRAGRDAQEEHAEEQSRDAQEEHAEEQRYAAVDVEVIRYESRDDRHGALETIFGQLSTRGKEPPRLTVGPMGETTP